MIQLQFNNFKNGQSGRAQLGQQTLDQTEWTIGRADTCDLVLTGEGVSRTHAKIQFLDSEYYLTDEQSTNGTFVNGKKLLPNQRHQLQAEDTLQMGKTTLYVEELMPLPQTIPQSSSNGNLPAAAHWTDQDLVVRCYRIVEETLDTKTFYFTSDPHLLFYYLPGQFVTIEVAIDGKVVRRAYSISSSPSRPYSLSLTVKRCSGGLVSNWLNDRFKVGSTLKLVGGPMGHFTCLPDLPTKLLFISAGSGITPVMSMLRWIYDTASDTDITFIHCARTPSDIIFHSELQMMSAQMPNLHLCLTVSRSQLGTPWEGLTGRISKEMLQLVVPDLIERHVFCCGPNEFMQRIKTTLEDMQLPVNQYQQESFGICSQPASTPSSETAKEQTPSTQTQTVHQAQTEQSGTTTTPATQAATPSTEQESNSESQNGKNLSKSAPTVCFSKSNQTAPAEADTSILAIAEQIGVVIQNACRAGVCGMCKVLVKEGEVEHAQPPMALHPDDESAGYVLACIACPVSRVVVEA